MGLLQSASGTAASGTTVAATFGSSTSGGPAIIAMVGNQTNRTVSSVALGGSSDTFTKAVGVTEGTFGEDAEIWADAADSSGHTVVTATFGSAITDAEINIVEWAGISSGTADKTHTGTAATPTSTWSSGATSALAQASEVGFGLIVVNSEGSAVTITGPASPWTNLAQLNPGTGIAQMCGYQQVSATTALTYNGSTNTNVAYASVIATFKLTSSPPNAIYQVKQAVMRAAVW